MERSKDSSGSPLEMDTARVDGVLAGRLDAALAQWVEQAMVDEAAASRARRHWLSVQAEAEASMAGVLVDLGERGLPILLSVDEHSLRGHIVGIGADFVVLARHDHRTVIVPTAAIGMVRSVDDVTVWGDRKVRVETTLAGIIGPIAADRPEVTVWTSAGAVNGRLASAGDDVLRIRSDGGPASWVSLSALRCLVLN